MDSISQTLSRASPYLIVLGRTGLASLFLLGGANKLVNYTATVQSMHEAGLAGILLPCVIALELGGGTLIALGHRSVPVTALVMAGFTLATNVFFHDFWTMDGDRATLGIALFFKNVSIAGALIFIAGISAQEQLS